MLGTCKSPQKSAVWLLLFFILYKMDNTTILLCIREMTKQFNNLKDQDKYREKCIDLVWKTFNVDFYHAEVLFDLAESGDVIYLTDTDTEIEFNIKRVWYFECSIHNNCYIGRQYEVLYRFWRDVNILDMLKELDRIAKSIEKLTDEATETETMRDFLSLI